VAGTTLDFLKWFLIQLQSSCCLCKIQLLSLLTLKEPDEKFNSKFNYVCFIFGKRSLDRISLDIFTWSNNSVKSLKFRRLTKLFDQLPKSISSFLAVDWIFLKA
jgi:hypothetical protein